LSRLDPGVRAAVERDLAGVEAPGRVDYERIAGKHGLKWRQVWAVANSFRGRAPGKVEGGEARSPAPSAPERAKAGKLQVKESVPKPRAKRAPAAPAARREEPDTAVYGCDACGAEWVWEEGDNRGRCPSCGDVFA
jgi:hypothetical protein